MTSWNHRALAELRAQNADRITGTGAHIQTYLIQRLNERKPQNRHES